MRNLMRERAVRRLSGVALLGCMVVALLAGLMGCSGNCGPTTLPTLHYSRVRKVFTFPNEYEGNSATKILATFVATDRDGSPAQYALADNNGDMDAINLNTGSQSPVNFGVDCVGPPAVTSDGLWIACDADMGIEVAPLSLSNATQANLLLPLNQNNLSVNIAWAPDSHHFAVLVNGALDLYLANATYTRALPTAQIDVRQATGCASTGVSLCPISHLAWSPDGMWLSYVIGSRSAILGAIAVVHLAPLLPDIMTVHSHPIARTLTNSQVTVIGSAHWVSAPSWRPGTTQLTYIPEDGARIVGQAVPSGELSVMLTQKTLTLGEVAWTPDGRELVFTARFEYIPPEATETPAPTFFPPTPFSSPISTSTLAPIAAATPAESINGGRSLSVGGTVRILGICYGPQPDLYVYTPPSS